ncbi:MAG: ABC transporter permease [Clostridiales bacterium]|nr:ABC transporter permease [Clostridiales bacterium]
MAMPKTQTENRSSFTAAVSRFSKEYMILLALLVLVVIFSITSPYFLTANNIVTILLQSSTIAIVAIGQAFVVLNGNLDLSLGQSVCLTSYAAALLMVRVGMNPWMALLCCIILACFIGLINGILVAYFNISSFIATLGMMNVCTGMAKILSNSASIANLPKQIAFIGRGYIAQPQIGNAIPVSVAIMLVLYIIASFVAKKTPLGRYIYAIGGSREAAFYSGISVKPYTLVSFVLAGLMVGLGSSVLLSRLDAATISSGKAYEFDAVIGCVLGGISMAGGKGKIIQALFGVLFLTVFSNGMTQLNVNPFIQDVIKGLVLIIAVLIDSMRNKVKN